MVKLGRPPKTVKCDIIINDVIVQHISTKKITIIKKYVI